MKRFFIFIAVLSLLVAFGNEGWVKFYKLRQVAASLEDQNRLIYLQNERIRTEIANLQDSKYLERFIRNELGYTREGEFLYEFTQGRSLP